MGSMIKELHDLAEKQGWVVALIEDEYGDLAGFAVGTREWILDQYGTDAQFWTPPKDKKATRH